MLGRSDIESFTHRLAFLTARERVSADARTCREVRHLLRQFRALGLTLAGGPAGGLPDDFAVRDSDIPVKPDEPEAGRDLPPEIMRQLCDQLPRLEEVSCHETRTAAELVIDTGRRPDEICALPWDCLEYDEPGHEPVLVYFNHKSARQGRRLPVARATAGLIVAQKARVRDMFPDTPLGELKLLPAASDRGPAAGAGCNTSSHGVRCPAPGMVAVVRIYISGRRPRRENARRNRWLSTDRHGHARAALVACSGLDVRC
jgi:hypothetical protein